MHRPLAAALAAAALLAAVPASAEAAPPPVCGGTAADWADADGNGSSYWGVVYDGFGNGRPEGARTVRLALDQLREDARDSSDSQAWSLEWDHEYELPYAVVGGNPSVTLTFPECADPARPTRVTEAVLDTRTQYALLTRASF
ncbi:hypothetical protein ACIO3O_28725 [Streptomyces sp. NPDC087440]|uniref:hypothetical protein n=1 Tax=Streptomyces sp. NPDC087440 TaxID=3365790 RepID=UPI003807E740